MSKAVSSRIRRYFAVTLISLMMMGPVAAPTFAQACETSNTLSCTG